MHAPSSWGVRPWNEPTPGFPRPVPWSRPEPAGRNCSRSWLPCSSQGIPASTPRRSCRHPLPQRGRGRRAWPFRWRHGRTRPPCRRMPCLSTGRSPRRHAPSASWLQPPQDPIRRRPERCTAIDVGGRGRTAWRYSTVKRAALVCSSMNVGGWPLATDAVLSGHQPRRRQHSVCPATTRQGTLTSMPGRQTMPTSFVSRADGRGIDTPCALIIAYGACSGA